jgi:hypothetical protein
MEPTENGMFFETENYQQEEYAIFEAMNLMQDLRVEGVVLDA